MYIISHLVKDTIPNYLAGLPIPDSIGGWFRLGGKKTCVSFNLRKINVLCMKCLMRRLKITVWLGTKPKMFIILNINWFLMGTCWLFIIH
jgi:hypothetical protein